MKRRPWYMNPVQTCCVLNKIASRLAYDAVAVTMDHCTTMLWSKQEAWIIAHESK
jgi:hypothetical protein